MAFSQEYKSGDYIYFSNSSEEYIGVVKRYSSIPWEGWVEVIFYWPQYMETTVNPKNTRLATDVELCLLRMEGWI